MPDPQSPEHDSDEELKQVLAAAFGADALEMLAEEDDDQCDDIPLEHLFESIPGLKVNQSPDHEDSPKLRWMKELTQSIYADRLSNSTTRDARVAHPDTARDSRFLVFSIGQQRFGLPLPSVREIGRLSVVTPLPFTPNYLRGVTNLRGEILSVTDFRNLIQDPGRRPPTGEKIIILYSSQQNSETALVVDQVIGIRDLASQPIKDLADANPSMLAVAIGTVTFDEQTTILIEGEQVLDRASLLQPSV